jgi:hypothetical protein
MKSDSKKVEYDDETIDSRRIIFWPCLGKRGGRRVLNVDLTACIDHIGEVSRGTIGYTPMAFR